MNNSCAALSRHHFLSHVRHQNAPQPHVSTDLQCGGSEAGCEEEKVATWIHCSSLDALFVYMSLDVFRFWCARHRQQRLRWWGHSDSPSSKLQVFPEPKRHLVLTKYCRASSWLEVFFGGIRRKRQEWLYPGCCLSANSEFLTVQKILYVDD